MLIQDIKPPIQKVIRETTEGTVRQYKKFHLFVRTSKYGLPVVIIIISLLGASIVVAIPDDNKSAIFYPEAIRSQNWENVGSIEEIDLGKNAGLSKFDNTNSAYLYFTDLVKEPDEEDAAESQTSIIDLIIDSLKTEDSPTETQEGPPSAGEPVSPVEESTTTKEVVEPEPSPVEATITEPQPEAGPSPEEEATTTELTPTSTEPLTEELPVEATITEPQPEVVPPPAEEATTTEGPVTYFFNYIRSKFTTKAQLAPIETEGVVPPPPPEPLNNSASESSGEQSAEQNVIAEPEPPVEEIPPVEEPAPTSTQPEVTLPTVDGDPPVPSGGGGTPSDTELPAETPEIPEVPEPASPVPSEAEVPDAGQGRFPVEVPEIIDAIRIFSNSEGLLLARLAPGDLEVDSETPVNNVDVNLSFAMEGRAGEDDLLLIEYRTNQDATWNQLALLTQDEEHSNKRNGGYFTYNIAIGPDTNVGNLREIEVRVTHFSNNAAGERLPILIDAIWLDVDYLDIVREDVFADQIGDIDTFRPDQEPEFEFKYISQRNPLEKVIGFIMRDKEQFRLKSHNIKFRDESRLLDNIESQVTYDIQVEYETEIENEEGEMEMVVEQDEGWSLKLSKPPKDVKIGKYIVDLYMEDDGKILKQEVEFFWGVLAINTNKSIYLSSEALAAEGLPPEIAHIGMAVLTDAGKTVCDANLRLTITTPSGELVGPQVDRNSSCGPTTVTNKPDYISAYEPRKTGTYIMRLDRLDKAGALIHAMEDTFEVQDSVPYEIERDGPTRIYPLADYTMNIIITANEEYSGTVTETVPASFGILKSNRSVGESVSGEEKTLTWNLNMTAGETYEIRYTFDPPNISPELHLLGPLQIGTFTEARRWQIASDAVPIVEGFLVTDGGSGTRTSLTMNVPSGIAVGELLLVIVGSDDAGNGDELTINASTYPGWTKIGESGDASARAHIGAFWKEATSTSGNDVTVDAASSDEMFGWYLRISGTEVTDPINISNFPSQSTGDANSHVIPGITTTRDNTLGIYGLGFDGGDGDPFTVSGGSWVEQDEVDAGTTGNDASGAWGKQDNTPTGLTADATVGTNESDGAAYFQLAVNAPSSTAATNYEQSAFRWYENADATTTGAVLAAQDASTTLSGLGRQFRLRLALHATTTSGTSTDSFRLQFATSTPGGCDTSFSGETYVNVATSTGDIRYFDNPSVANAVLMGASTTDPAHSGHTTTTQTYHEQNDFTVTSTLATATDGIWDLVLDDALAVKNKTYCFRVIESAGAILTTYSVIPEITTPNATHEQLTIEGYTWENDDATGTDPDNNSIQAGSDFTTGANQLTGTNTITKGERVTLRMHVKNTGTQALDSDLALFYDRNDNIWTKVEEKTPPDFGVGDCNDTNWDCTLIHATDKMGASTAIAISPDGAPWISYMEADTDGGGCGAGECDLYIAQYVGSGGTGCAGGSSAWSCTLVDNTDSLLGDTSIAFGASSTPWIAYSETLNDVLKVAQYTGSGSESSCGGGNVDWICVDVEASGITGRDPAIAIDPSGIPWISYGRSSDGDLKVAQYTGSGSESSCAGGSDDWDCTVVEGTDDVGLRSSIAFNSNGNAWISYHSVTGADLRVAEFTGSGTETSCTGGSDKWDCVIVSGTAPSGDTSIAIDPAGNPWITWYTGLDLNVAQYTGSGSETSCTGGSDNWDCVEVDDQTTQVGDTASIAFDPAGNPWISYTEFGLDHKLRVAHFTGSGSEGSCGSGSADWDCGIVKGETSVSTGHSTDIAFDSSGNAWVSYQDSTNSNLEVAQITRAGEIVISPGLANADNASLRATSTTESHADMTTASNSANRTDADCITGGATWNDGVWTESEEIPSSIISLSPGNITAQCSEFAWVIDTSQAQASTTYRFTLATKDNWRSDKGPWRGLATTTNTCGSGGSDSCYPTLEVENVPATSTIRYSKDNQPRFENCDTFDTGTDGSADWGCLIVVSHTVGQAYQDPYMAISPEGTPWFVSGNRDSDTLAGRYVGSGGNCSTFDGGSGSDAWECFRVFDDADGVGKLTPAWSLAFGPNGNPWISFYDTEQSPDKSGLMVAEYVGSGGDCDDSTQFDSGGSDAWDCTRVVGSDDSMDASITHITFDPSGNPWVAFIDEDGTAESLAIATYVGSGGNCDNFDGSGGSTAWKCETIVDGLSTNPLVLEFDQNGIPWVTFLHSGTNPEVSIAQYVGSGGNCDTFDAPGSDAWECTVIVETDNGNGAASQDDGEFMDFAFDPSGNPYVVFHNDEGTSTPPDSVVVANYVGTASQNCDGFDGAGGSDLWNCVEIYQGNNDGDGKNTSIAFDATGIPWVSFTDFEANRDLLVAREVGSGGNCDGFDGAGGSDAWECTTVVDADGNNYGFRSTIVFGPAGTPWVSFHNQASPPGLAVAKLHLPPTQPSATSSIAYPAGSAGTGDARYRLDSGESPRGTCAGNTDYKGYCGVSANDSDYDSIDTDAGVATSTQYPLYVFAVQNSTSSDQPNATWIGQSDQDPSVHAIDMEIYRFGSTSSTLGWQSLSYDTNTCSSGSTSTDCTIVLSATTSISEYFEADASNYWAYFRVFQATSTGNIQLKTNSFAATFGAAVGIDISGTSDLATSTVVALAYNSTLQSATTSVTGSAFTFTSITAPSNGQTVTVWASNVADANEATGVTKYDGSGNIDNMTLNTHKLTIGSDDNGSLTVSNLGQYDRSDDEDIMHSATTTELDIDPGDSYTDDQVVISTSTLTIAATEGLDAHDLLINASGTLTSVNTATFTISGSWARNSAGTFTPASSTVTFDGTATGETIATNNASTDFWDVVFNGSGGGWSFTTTSTIDNDMTMTLGTLDNSNGTSSITVNGGDVTGNGTINLTGEAFTANATGSFGGTTNWTFNNLTFGGGTAGTITGTSTNEITVTSVLNIASGHILDAFTKTWNLTGSGTPFTIPGTLIASTSTFDYEGISATNIATTTYYNLRSVPASGSPTHTLLADTVAVNNDFTVGDGTNAVTVDANTNDPVLDVDNDFTVNTSGTFTASNSGLSTIARNMTNNGTFTNATGTVTFDGSSVTSTISGSGNPAITFYNLTSTTTNKVLEFATSTGDKTFQIDGLFTITGTSGNEVKLQSTASGTQWFINHQGTESVDFASVLDGGCASTSTNINTNNSIDRGNNDSCWVFTSLSFTIDAVSRSLSLTDGNNKTATTSNLLTVTVTGGLGYDLTAYQTQQLTHQNAVTTIVDWTGTSGLPTVWTGTCSGASECGWGYNSSDPDLGFTNSTYYAAFTTSTPGNTVADATSSVTGASTTITYRSSVSNTQSAGEYSTTIRYILTAEF